MACGGCAGFGCFGWATLRVATTGSPVWFRIAALRGSWTGSIPMFRFCPRCQTVGPVDGQGTPCERSLRLLASPSLREGDRNAQSGLSSTIDRILPIWSCSLSSWRVRLDVFRIHERSSRPWAGIPCDLVGLLGFACSRPLTLREGDGWLVSSSASRFTKGTGGSLAHLRPVSRRGRVARRLICVAFHERDGWLVGSSASRFTKGTVARRLIRVPV